MPEAIELAGVSVVLIAGTLGITELSQRTSTVAQVENAARAGAMHLSETHRAATVPLSDRQKADIAAAARAATAKTLTSVEATATNNDSSFVYVTVTASATHVPLFETCFTFLPDALCGSPQTITRTFVGPAPKGGSRYASCADAAPYLPLYSPCLPW